MAGPAGESIPIIATRVMRQSPGYSWPDKQVWSVTPLQKGAQSMLQSLCHCEACCTTWTFFLNLGFLKSFGSFLKLMMGFIVGVSPLPVLERLSGLQSWLWLHLCEYQFSKWVALVGSCKQHGVNTWGFQESRGEGVPMEGIQKCHTCYHQ